MLEFSENFNRLDIIFFKISHIVCKKLAVNMNYCIDFRIFSHMYKKKNYVLRNSSENLFTGQIHDTIPESKK